jgi:hypothetical protein
LNTYLNEGDNDVILFDSVALKNAPSITAVTILFLSKADALKYGVE